MPELALTVGLVQILLGRVFWGLDMALRVIGLLLN